MREIKFRGKQLDNGTQVGKKAELRDGSEKGEGE